MLKIVKSHCNRCGRNTSHDQLFLYQDKDDAGVEFTEFEFLKCRGCDHPSVRRTYSNEYDVDENGKVRTYIGYFPAPISRQKPKWLDDFDVWIEFPSDLEEVLEEIYSALHSDLRRLATMGIRTLIDMVMIKNVGDSRSFNEKLAKFMEAGFISAKQRDFISSVIAAGSASAHRGYNPSKEDLHALMDIVEGVVAAVYVHPLQGDKLKKGISGRVKE